jgi:hypothetical protein
VLRYSQWDAVLIGLSFVYAALLLSAPSIPLVGIGLWWTANTVAHNFIHTPFFQSRALNRAYALLLTALMGVPQSPWRGRHLGITASSASTNIQIAPRAGPPRSPCGRATSWWKRASC